MNQQSDTQNKALTHVKQSVIKKIVFAAIALAVIIAAAIGLKKFISFDNKTTKIGFEDIGELATQVAYCTEVNVTQASRDFFGVTIPFTESKYIYSYDIEIKAGLDFCSIDWSVDEATSTINVTLPEIKILSSSIDPDSFKLYHEAESIFREITMEENNAALASLKEAAEQDAIANGLIENAEENAKAILTGFFGNVYDLKEYSIQFKNK